MDRVTVAEAARRLGISKDAIRQRIRRGTLEHERDEQGTVYVLLAPEATHGDTVGNAGEYDPRDELIEVLRAQLDEANRSNAEHRRLLAAALERVPAIEPPRDERGSTETPTEGETGTGTGARDTEPPRASWWRRWFGF